MARAQTKPRATVHQLRLVPPNNAARDDIVHLLTCLMGKAWRGELTGLVCVAMQPGRQYEILLSGSCRDNPTFTAGALTVAAQRFADNVDA